MTLNMMIGIPGSGKSTFAQEYLSGTYLSSDDLRDELGKIDIWEEMHVRTEEALRLGEDVIYDATNIKKKDRKTVLELAKEYGARSVAYVMDTPFEECLERNKMRDVKRIVPVDVVERMRENYELTTYEEFDEIIHVDP